MSRRRKKPNKREEEQRRQEEARRARKRRRKKRVISVIVVISLIALVAHWGVTNAPPRDWVTCYSKQNDVVQHTHFALYIQIGEMSGELNVSFIRIPENLGLSPGGGCMWPMHTHGDTPGERDQKYTRVHVEAPNTHNYSLGDFFESWSEWQGYPANIYFASDGVSYYRTQNLEIRIKSIADDPGIQNYEYASYVPKDGDYVEIVVHEPYTVVPGPYPGGELPIDADWFYTPVQGQSRTLAFQASASGGVAPYEFEWDFGDGSRWESGAAIIHQYAQPGSYLVSLYVTDSNGITVKISHGAQVA